jgi:GT2 family glycosyltransferase
VHVSVIIPTYNRAAVLGRALDSVLAQTYQDVEIFVVDDGSTDQTAELLHTYVPRVTVLTQANSGISRARNRGIHASSGEYVAFLDSDDAWLPRKLERQIDILTHQPDIPVCHTEEIWIRRGVRVNPMQKHHKSGGYIFPACLPFCVISPSAALIRRALFEMVGYFDERLPVCEDYDLWLRIAKTYPVAFIAEPLIVKYGGHADQLSHSVWGLDRFRIQALEKLLRAGGLTAEQRQQTLNELQKKCEIVANGCLKRQKLDEWRYYSHLFTQYL